MLPVIPGYTISELLYTGKNTLIYRGSRNGDKNPVILKITKEEKVYEDALKNSTRQSELTQIKERIKQYKSALEYVLNLFKND